MTKMSLMIGEDYRKRGVAQGICIIDSCGKQRKSLKLCSAHYHRYQRYGDPLGKPEPPVPYVKPICSVEICDRYSHARGWCPAHYVRWKKHGTPLDHMPLMIEADRSIHNKYLRITVKGHPLSDTGGRLAEHRLVLYTEIGPGGHKCNWCDKIVYWELDHNNDYENALVVDHLNHRRRDNRLNNLVVSCGPCNSVRWAWKTQKEVVK